jgi:hypothetical protein
MNNFRLIYLLIIPIYFLLVGCASDKTHNIKYYGAFFYDSVTIGAIRIEYNQTSTPSVTGTDYGYEDVEQWLDFYNIPLAKVTRSTLIAKNLRGPIPVQTRFVAPWLLYQIRRETDCVEMMNVESGQKWTITKHFDYPNGISTSGTYALVGASILKREDGTVFKSFSSRGGPFYFDEDSMIIFSVEVANNSDKYIKIYLTQNRTDTLNIPQQDDKLRMIGSKNNYVMVNAIGISVTGEPSTTCGIVPLKTFKTGNFIATPLKCHVCDGEYLPDKGYWITGEVSIYFGNIQDSIFPTTPILKSTWSKK